MTSKVDQSMIVTVIVLTFNSSKYLFETLESIKKQSYPHLSLIITDDCSTDNTVDVCKKWVSLNESRFVETQILESPINTGVSGNGNRGAAACKTKWVKGIAGDDLLMPNCIQDNVDFIQSHPEVHFLFSRIVPFGRKQQNISNLLNSIDYRFFDLSMEEQLNRLIFKGNCIPAPSFFYDVSVLREHNISNDERIPMMEDAPKWINILRKGLKLSFMDKETVLYRVSQTSLSGSEDYSPLYYKSLISFRHYYLNDEYVKKWGEQKAFEIELQNQLDVYNKYLFFKNLPIVVLYTKILQLKKKFSFNLKRFLKIL